VQQNSRGNSCGQSRVGGGRDTQHLQLFGPQVECNRTVEEIAVDRAGEEAEEILSTYICLALRLSATGQSRR
jgi:hypothetical protein